MADCSLSDAGSPYLQAPMFVSIPVGCFRSDARQVLVSFIMCIYTVYMYAFCFGAVKMATLSGFLFVFRQLGSFFSSWLGGISVEATGGYVVIWSASALLAAFAASCCFRVKDPEIKN